VGLQESKALFFGTGVFIGLLLLGGVGMDVGTT